MNIVVVGPQGSGKGTQAKKLASTYGIAHIASGDLYREAIARGSELGGQVAPLLAAGQLVPDEITIGMLAERRPVREVRAEHVARRDVRQARALREADGLGALPRSRRAEEHDVAAHLVRKPS